MKTFIVFFTSIFFSLAVQAQMTIGPRLGVNFSKQALNSPYEVWNTGTLFGGVINIPFKNDISFQGEFLFSQKGYREEFNGNESYDDLTSTYMEAPILVNYLYSTGRINFFGNGGVFAAYWKSGTYESKIGENDILIEDYQFTTSSDDDGFKDNRLDYGLVIGAGILYDKIGTSGNIILEFRYTKGLAPISSLENASLDFVPGKNTSLSISLAYMLYL